MGRILITSARAPVALDLMRQMARAGHDVWLTDSLYCPASAFSRFSKGFIRTPAPRANPQAYIAALVAITKKYKIDLLIPTCEEVFYISKYRHCFDNPDIAFCSEFELLNSLHNKFSFAKNICHSDVHAPETFLLASPLEVAKFADRSHEWVFKPVYSRFAARTLIGPTADKLQHLAPCPGDLWIAQRLISGREVCSYSIAKNGVLLAHALYHPLYRLGQSSSFYFSPQENPKIEKFVKDFIAVNHFTGQISFDYICEKEGSVYVLECNPRAISGLHLLSKHTDFPAAFYGKSKTLVSPTGGPHMLTLGMLLFALPEAIKNKLFGRFVIDMRSAREAVCNADDMGPCLAQVLMMGEFIARSLRHKISLTVASCRDIEWDGQPI